MTEPERVRRALGLTQPATPRWNPKALAERWRTDIDNAERFAAQLSTEGAPDEVVVAVLERVLKRHGKHMTDYERVLAEAACENRDWPGSDAHRAGRIPPPPPRDPGARMIVVRDGWAECFRQMRAGDICPDAPDSVPAQIDQSELEAYEAAAAAAKLPKLPDRMPGLLHPELVVAALERHRAEEQGLRREVIVPVRYAGPGYVREGDVEEANRLWGRLCRWKVSLSKVDKARTEAGPGAAPLVSRLARLQVTASGDDDDRLLDRNDLLDFAEQRRVRLIEDATESKADRQVTNTEAVRRHRHRLRERVRAALLAPHGGEPVCNGFQRDAHGVASVAKLDLHRIAGGGGALRDVSTDGEWREAAKLGKDVGAVYALFCRKCHRAADKARREGRG
jgi:hypothetical protein